MLKLKKVPTTLSICRLETERSFLRGYEDSPLNDPFYQNTMQSAPMAPQTNPSPYMGFQSDYAMKTKTPNICVYVRKLDHSFEYVVGAYFGTYYEFTMDNTTPTKTGCVTFGYSDRFFPLHKQGTNCSSKISPGIRKIQCTNTTPPSRWAPTHKQR